MNPICKCALCGQTHDLQDDECPPKTDSVVTVTAVMWDGPATIAEAQSFDSGYKSGLTAYARETGASTLKSKNELLARLMDEQGWRTIETFEKLSAAGEGGSDLLTMADEFDKLASIPVDPANVRGLSVSRMHFEQWRDRLRAIAGR